MDLEANGLGEGGDIKDTKKAAASSTTDDESMVHTTSDGFETDDLESNSSHNNNQSGISLNPFQRQRGESKLAMLKPQFSASLEVRDLNYFIKMPKAPATWYGRWLAKVTGLIPYFPQRTMKRQILNGGLNFTISSINPIFDIRCKLQS